MHLGQPVKRGWPVFRGIYTWHERIEFELRVERDNPFTCAAFAATWSGAFFHNSRKCRPSTTVKTPRVTKKSNFFSWKFFWSKKKKKKIETFFRSRNESQNREKKRRRRKMLWNVMKSLRDVCCQSVTTLIASVPFNVFTLLRYYIVFEILDYFWSFFIDFYWYSQNNHFWHDCSLFLKW